MQGVLSRLYFRATSALAHVFWGRIERRSGSLPKSQLAALMRRSKRLRRVLERFEASAQSRINPSVPGWEPENARWALRVDMFEQAMTPSGYAPLADRSTLSAGITVYTDDTAPQVGLRQIELGERSRFGLVLDVYALAGSFLSFAVGLPKSRAQALSPSDLVACELEATFETPVDISIRLNLRSGPNTERVIRPWVPGQAVEFDLFYADFDPERMQDAWIDIILPPHAMNRIELRDLRIWCSPRAEL